MNDILKAIYDLKQLERTGWAIEGVGRPETVAEHSFGTAMLALILSQKRDDIDKNKVVKMALIHDLAEARVGDILVDWKIKGRKEQGIPVPIGGNHGITEEDKFRLEKEAMKSLTKSMDNGDELMSLWIEFEENKTKDAVFVKGCDKLDMLLQILEYRDRQVIDLTHWKSPTILPKDPGVRTLYEKILNEGYIKKEK